MEKAITEDSEARWLWVGLGRSSPFPSFRALPLDGTASCCAVNWLSAQPESGIYAERRAEWVAANIAASVGLRLLRSPTPEGGVIALILTCVFSVLALRVSLVLPAVAVLSPVSWVEVWKVTRGYTWPIVFGAILAAAPLFIGQIALGTLITPDMTQSSYVLSTVVLGLAEAVLLVVSVGYLSFAYQWFFERNGYASGRAS